MNIKRFLLCSAVGVTCLGALAVPAKRGARTFTQADGSTITVNLVGDEHFHSYVTTDGLAVERKADGNFYYRTADAVSDIVAHNAADRSAVEVAGIKMAGERFGISGIIKQRRNDISARRKVRSSAQRKELSQVPNNGSPRVPILLVQYKDYKFKDSDPKATFTEFFETGAVSARSYFTDQSNGKYTPQFDVYGPVTLSGNRTVYGGNDYEGNDKGVGKMVGEGCQLLDSQIDFSRYDNDGDGECDVVIVLYAGDGEASSYEDDAEDAVWPCQWQLSESEFGKSLTLDRTRVDKFAVFNELNGMDLTKIDGIGTFCHEFSHCLGLPDFYDTQYGGHFGMAHWSLMDYGSYNDDGYTPIGYSAYEKEFMGWIDIEEAKEDTYYTMPVFNLKDLATDKAVKLTNSRDKNEYYIIENRAQQGWDKYMPAEGLLITHVTYDASAWYNNEVNDHDMQRMTPVPADNSLRMDTEYYYGETYYVVNENDLLGDLWPYANATELTDTSVPAAKVNTGSLLGKPVTEITRNDDGTISFWAMKAPKPAVATPVNHSHEVNSPSSVTLSWNPGDNSDVTYTVEIKEHKDITYELVNSTSFTEGIGDWVDAGFVETTSTDGARFGSTKQQGSLTSPLFEGSADGIVTVAFTAKYYSSDGSSVSVNLCDKSGNVIDSKTISLTAGFKAYSVVLNGQAEAPFKVEFSTVEKKKRFYVLKTDIYTGDASEVAGKSSVKALASESGDALKRTITGITDTSYTVTGLRENTVYDYRVKAVPVDADNFAHSAWTEFATVDLSSTTGVENISGETAPAEYYNLQGVRVSAGELAPGIYIRRQGESVSKILVK